MGIRFIHRTWTNGGEVTNYQKYNHHKLSMLSLCHYNTIHMIYFPLGNYAKAQQITIITECYK